MSHAVEFLALVARSLLEHFNNESWGLLYWLFY